MDMNEQSAVSTEGGACGEGGRGVFSQFLFLPYKQNLDTFNYSFHFNKNCSSVKVNPGLVPSLSVSSLSHFMSKYWEIAPQKTLILLYLDYNRAQF